LTDRHAAAYVMRAVTRQPLPAATSHLAPIVRFGIPALLVVLVVLCFHPVLDNGFVTFDDDAALTENPHYRGLSPAHLAWMFTTFHLGHYQPLSWLTHGLVYVIWGMDPVGYHLVNLILHAANAVLAYLLIVALLSLWFPAPDTNLRWLRGAAGVGALFFALHPLRVEPVAWATERREVLCSFFLLLTVWAYVRMQQVRPEAAWRRWFFLSVVAYALSLLSKAMGLTLPVVLLALDVYPLRRFTGAHRAGVLVEKVPYVVLAAGAAALAVFGVRHEGMVPFAEYGVLDRLMQAAYGLCFYLWKTIVPAGLSPLYELERPLDLSRPRYVVSAVVVVSVTAAVVGWRRRYPWALLAWICYAVMVSPVLGLLQSGPQIAADRYTYLPCLPWAVLVAAGTYQLWFLRADTRSGTPSALLVALAATLAVFGVLTYRQTQVWKDSLTLWNHVLGIEPTNSFAHNNRGTILQARGDIKGALADYSAAIAVSPEYIKAYNNRGVARQANGDVTGALEDYDRALRLNPSYTDAYVNRGSAREASGNLQGARADYDQALRLDAGHVIAYYNRGNVQRTAGNGDAALADYTTALRLDPQFARAYSARGSLREARGDFAGALADVEAALRVDPQDARARAGRGRLRQSQGDLDGALADFDAALRLNPKDSGTYNNRGVVRHGRGDLEGAIADYSQALALAPLNAPYRVAFESNLARAQQEHAAGAPAQF
jgi:tetratricopeptide (TPR) repeat protein